MSTITRLTFSLAALALTAGPSADAFACGGGGGGYRGRVSIGYGGGGYHAPRYTPTYRQPVYRQPVYQQPVAPQRIVQQPVIQQQPFVQQQPIQQPVAQQPAIQQPIAPQAPQQPVAAPSAASPQQTALDALMSLSGGQAAPSAPQAIGHVGAWRATVGSSQVQLTLNADGSFRWNANANGKASTFAGRFSLAGGQLTLVRADNQQLAGSWVADATGGFRFKLAGAQDSGLLFVRG
ncbi:hypothetical protein MalM25_23100 [Planctomycetes bacterium MalM25]|nr:hypothetical protein MalM25_23100 [Planctomycetes bacterium MalM25]